ncbi:DnaJ homolog subfamily C member 2 [Entomortierella parvispora]|uniref:DnaJ homolog subfamily C member 2 n=1 Tax=Entomortierella parvispora TaxID=205924 RepID=A0A9P3LSQ0_9FUNG|nr:DnaJ homolog subfamily C member 2 [Entomortierella parvispora]
MVMDFLLPSPPKSWSADKTSAFHAKITAPTKASIQPAGRHFLAHARRHIHMRTFSEDEKHVSEAEAAAKNAAGAEENDDDLGDEAEDAAMLKRDPKDWKDQDQYAVLGLSHLRYKATEDQIRRAHRRKVLKHHPDKKAAHGGLHDDGFFKCIQKAFETLMDPVKRRQWDSVDPNIPDEIPNAKSKADFYKQYAPVFERESRFSNTQPVPQLGNAQSTQEAVESFYDFWYKFDSWRTFEWMDKEDGEGHDSRDDKRYFEKKNKAERAKLKKEDNARLREIVDQALSLDPRIKLFKEAANKQRNAKRLEKEAAEKKAAEEAAAAAAAAEAAKIAAEEAEKAAREDGKKNKELLKRAVRKEKKNLKALIKDNNYFLPAGETAGPVEVEKQLELLDALLDGAKGLEQLESVRKTLEDGVKNGNIAEVFKAEVAKRSA